MKWLFSLIAVFLLITTPIFSATLEVDNMEYSTPELAQAAYITNATPPEVVDQENTVTNHNTGLGDWANIEYRQAQSFQLSGAKTVTAASIMAVAHSGSPTGNWTLRIETDNAGKPSGTLANANASIVVAPAGDNVETKGTFATPFVLVASTTYWLVVLCDNQATNQIWNLADNSGSVYANGNEAYSADAGATWTADTNVDLVFKVYVQGTLALQSYSESTIKTQGSYALKAVAAITDSLNKTLTKTFAVNSNLTGVKNLRLDVYALRTGSNFKIGLHDTGGTTTEITPNITTSNTWQPVNWDWSGVSDANKDNIDTCTITITNADSANTIYLDYHEIAQNIDSFGWVN